MPIYEAILITFVEIFAMHPYVREFLFWLVSILIATVLWFPVYSRIPFINTYWGIVQMTLVLQMFRWYIFYNQNIIFKKSWLKAAFILGSIILTWYWYSDGMTILRLIDEQNVSAIVSHTHFKPLSLSEVYHLLNYVRNLIMISVFCLFGLMIMLNLKIIYMTVGYGSEKVRRYIRK
jgi:hypothetical protein